MENVCEGASLEPAGQEQPGAKVWMAESKSRDHADVGGWGGFWSLVTLAEGGGGNRFLIRIPCDTVLVPVHDLSTWDCHSFCL